MTTIIKNIEELFLLTVEGKTLSAEMMLSPDDVRYIFHNFKIRPEFIRQEKVTRYAKIMRDGKWKCDFRTAPLVFGKGNILIDGLQRLCAVLIKDGEIKFNIRITDNCEVTHE